MSMQCLGLLDLGQLDLGRNESIESAQGSLIIHVRFLQLQQRRASGPTIAADIARYLSFGWIVSGGSVGTRRSRSSPVAPFR